MKKTILVLSLSATMLFGQTGSVSASSSLTDASTGLSEILKLQPDISKLELLQDVRAIAANTGQSEQSVLDQIYTELKNNDEKGKQEKATTSDISAYGASGGTKSVGSSTKGNFYYTPSQTAYLDHGHVGLYYTSTTIVESVPSAGVRTISTTARKVDSTGAKVKSVTTSTTNRNNAANWAKTQVGQSYSYNFATNRQTGHTGAKNCSKLIWSAYKLNGSLDLDVDGGLGVYPRDVRDAKGTALVRNI
ncbi:YiiX/YebB-like N1pC/P60 family cysteine hydrolase [Sporosarcina gallistercoris]|uniref:YiiX/YebB-like N1pC/P60 family cysteine hydrolase n=1 Tax=Sporosarcina gallistercoris TaxID=2762245 RepID=UPI003D2B1CA2